MSEQIDEQKGRRPAWMKKRKDFTAAVKKAVRERNLYMCEYPGCSTYPATEVDHVIPEALGGASTIDNAMLLCTACHRRKTALDVKLIAKADRQGGRSGQYARRKKRKGKGRSGSIPSRPMAGTKASGFKKKLDGSVQRR